MLAPFERTIEDADFFSAIFEEAVDDGARRAAGAKHDDGAGTFPPARSSIFEIGHKAVGVGVGASQLVIFEPERVCRSDRDAPRVPVSKPPKMPLPCAVP